VCLAGLIAAAGTILLAFLLVISDHGAIGAELVSCRSDTVASL
jgi:hypothetical protein